MATLDGANEIPVTDRHFKLFEVSYSHDGKTFAVSGDLATGLQTGLYSISEPSKSEIPIQPVIPQAAGSPVISDIVLASDGRGVYFMARTGEKAFDYDVYRMDVAGGAVQKLTAANGYATDLCVSDDGKTAAFLRWTSEWGSSPNLSRLYTLDLATKSTRASQVTGTQ